jgi:catechol 2,3-dioxygenase-like lactoylglutathione lyase family enzyme
VPRLVGINHVALEVGDVDEALEFYGRFFSFELRGRRPTMAWIDAGDQFVALARGDGAEAPTWRRRPAGRAGLPVRPSETTGRHAEGDLSTVARLDHVGIVVDDKEAVRSAAQAAGLQVAPSGSLRIRDPWGNVLEIVDYRDVQFTKTPEVLRGMGLDELEKSERALDELRAKGLAG